VREFSKGFFTMTTPINLPKSALRIGVDVGGTFTKAVAVRPQPFAIVAQAIVPTTHSGTEGVARGVVQALGELLAHPDVHGQPIAAVSHSTTQAVNALLEGDVVKVGIVGIGAPADAQQLRKLTSPGDIALAPGRVLPTASVWLDSPVTPERAESAVAQLQASGAGAIVASGMYSVDDPADELRVMEAGLSQTPLSSSSAGSPSSSFASPKNARISSRRACASARPISMSWRQKCPSKSR